MAAYPGEATYHWPSNVVNQQHHSTQAQVQHQMRQQASPQIRSYQSQLAQDQHQQQYQQSHRQHSRSLSQHAPQQYEYQPPPQQQQQQYQSSSAGQYRKQSHGQEQQSNYSTQPDATAAEALSRLRSLNHDQNTPNVSSMSSSSYNQQQPPLAPFGQSRHSTGSEQQRQSYASQPLHSPNQYAQQSTASEQLQPTNPSSTYGQQQLSINNSRFYPAAANHAQSNQATRPTSPFSWSQQTARPGPQPPTHGAQSDHSRSPSIAQMRGQSITPNAVQQHARFAPPSTQDSNMASNGVQHITVDPTHVYDRWPEQQRIAQQAEQQRKKAAAAAAAVEKSRKEAAERDEARRREEADLEKRRRDEELRKREIEQQEQQRRDEAQQRLDQENQERTRLLAFAASQGASALAAATTGGQLPAQVKQSKKKSRTKKADLKNALPSQQFTPPVTTTPAIQLPRLAAAVANAVRLGGSAPSPTVVPVTSWKAERKRRLADLIINWLAKHNEEVTVTSEEVFGHLDANVAYADFCDFLDRKGLCLNRARLAKIILEAEPDMKKQPPSSIPTAHAGPASSVAAAMQLAPIQNSVHLSSLAAHTGIAPLEHASSATVPPTSTSTQTLAPPVRHAHSPARAPLDLPPSEPPLFDDSPLLPQAEPSRPSALLSPERTPRAKQATPVAATAHVEAKRSTPLTKVQLAKQRGDAAFTFVVSSDEDEDGDAEIVSPAVTSIGAPIAINPPPSSMAVDGALGSEAEKTAKRQRPPPTVFVPSVTEAELYGKLLVQPITRNKISRKSNYDARTIARDVLLTTGRHPQMRPLNGHLEGLRSLLSNNSVYVKDMQFDLNTIRWDVLDPVPGAGVDDTMDADDEDEVSGLATVSRNIVHAEGAVVMTVGHMAGPSGKLKRKMGKRQGTGIAPNAMSMQPRVAADQSAGLRKSVLRNQSSNGQRSTAQGVEATESTAESPGVGQASRRGRPSRTAVEAEELIEADFNIYKCEWENCKAKLHNMDSLRKHINKVHNRRIRGSYLCRWGDCSATGRKPTEPSQRLHFSEFDPWSVHVETHLQPIARELGDGPRTNLSEAYNSELSDAYLSDTAGRVVTPRATLTSTFEQDQLQQGTLLGPVLRRTMPKLPGGLTEAQREDEQKLQQLEAKKLNLGPVFERGGARLATDERRRGLYDDEDFEGEYSADEEIPEPE